MTAFEKERETFSQKQNSGRKRNLFDRDCWILTRIVWNDNKSTSPKITAELNDHLEKPISSKTARRKLHKAVIRKPY